ncbi:hypothetical protein DFH27DRAFT_570460 [Peziza echinospora]|nr:hypothetical protein DFH27DRAFT_570460 [Peziza echinospora]
MYSYPSYIHKTTDSIYYSLPISQIVFVKKIATFLPNDLMCSQAWRTCSLIERRMSLMLCTIYVTTDLQSPNACLNTSAARTRCSGGICLMTSFALSAARMFVFINWLFIWFTSLSIPSAHASFWFALMNDSSDRSSLGLVRSKMVPRSSAAVWAMVVSSAYGLPYDCAC